MNENFAIEEGPDGIRIYGTPEQMQLWKENPVAFIEQLFDKPLEDWQKEVIRQQAREIELQEATVGFSLSGTGTMDDFNLDSVQMVQTVPHQRGKRLAGILAATMALGVQEFSAPTPLPEWTYAAPEPGPRNRQQFKKVASRRHHSGRKR